MRGCLKMVADLLGKNPSAKRQCGGPNPSPKRQRGGTPPRAGAWGYDCYKADLTPFLRPLRGASIALEGDGLFVDLRQGVHGRLLFRFLLVAAPGGREARPARRGGDLEALAMVGPLLVEQIVLRRRAVLALHH